jgi:hypothetical protein
MGGCFVSDLAENEGPLLFRRPLHDSEYIV